MSYPEQPGSPGSVSRRLTNRNTNRYSVTALFSMAAEQDVEVEDELAKAQKRLRDLKGRISAQSKRNFVLERDVRYLDSRIALLIQNRMALDEVRRFFLFVLILQSHLDQATRSGENARRGRPDRGTLS